LKPITRGPDLRRDVDEFLAAHKTLPAPGDWREVNRETERRLTLPIERAGEISPFDLVLVMSPDAVEPDLRIVLLYGSKCIWRLCLSPEYHPNSLRRPDDLPSSVNGPHHHTWHDNRHFAAANRLPKKLKNARILPDEIRSSDEAFRFFVEQIGVEFPSWGPPVWPKRTGLL
jgi:hypothetical protein